MLKVSIFNAQTWAKKITENSRNIHGKFTEEFTAKFTEEFTAKFTDQTLQKIHGEGLQKIHGKA